MTINAVLRRLVLSSPQPSELARFYSHAFDYQAAYDADECRCEAQGRSLWIRRGAANQLQESHFVFPTDEAWRDYAAQLEARRVSYRTSRLDDGAALVVSDPDGRDICFAVARSSDDVTMSSPRPARLQHYAVRTASPQKLMEFYVERLGFTLSDLVRDDAGELSAAFLRTDHEHHALAIFRAPEARFDHFSCETSGWLELRDWADHMASRSVRIVWGIGRHGPGNDTFFMVHDPDGNLAEISSDLEVCVDDRPVGFWKHRMETLNQWGVAIMRS